MTKSWVVANLYHHFHKVFRQLLVKRIVKYNDHSSLTTSGGDSRPYSDSRLSSDSRPYSDSRLTTRGGNSSQKNKGRPTAAGSPALSICSSLHLFSYEIHTISVANKGRPTAEGSLAISKMHAI